MNATIAIRKPLKQTNRLSAKIEGQSKTLTNCWKLLEAAGNKEEARKRQKKIMEWDRQISTTFSYSEKDKISIEEEERRKLVLFGLVTFSYLLFCSFVIFLCLR